MTESLTDFRSLAHRAVTEGVNLRYVEQMRQALYEAADEIEQLRAELIGAQPKPPLRSEPNQGEGTVAGYPYGTILDLIYEARREGRLR